MTDRYRGSYAQPGRSATFNPARASMPSSIGYSSLYAGDMHVMPSSTRQPTQHPTTTPRGYITSTSTAGTPTTTTRTYTVTQDPRSLRPAVRDLSRTRSGRSSTLDSNTQRPPVIVTTTQKDRPHVITTQHANNNRTSSPPIRDEYRASEGQFFTQPASSMHGRGTARPQSAMLDHDEYLRHRERNDSMLASDTYRNARPSVVYPSNPRHSTATVDYGDEGYQYTNAGELARYDLDQTRPPAPPPAAPASAPVPPPRPHSRHGSMDRPYHRPNISYNPDQRNINVNPSPDLSRNYNMNTSRIYETRGGPPPSTRGFDKLNRGVYDHIRDPPNSPLLLETGASGQLEPAGAGGDGRRARPVSLYQDSPTRSIHHEDYYRSREDERNMRELRDRETERIQNGPYFHDERVPSRGFGIRTDSVDDRRRLSDYRPEEPRKRSDENLPREPDYDRPRSRLETKDPRRERRESRRGSDEDDKERTRLRDKIATGLGVAATAVGLTPLASKDDEKRDKDKETRRRRPSDEERERERDRDRDRERERERERWKEADGYDRPRVPERERSRVRDDRDRRDSRIEPDYKERIRRDVDPRQSEQAVASASDSDEGKRSSRRHRPSNAFNPNDAGDLKQIKEQLAAMKTSDKDQDEDADRGKPFIVDPPRREPSPPAREPSVEPIKDDDSRGRELASNSSDEKQVRVVSPPREKKDEKPLKGILKQPKSSFPEEPNPVREGVAPHKEDKKIKEAPPGAKWTKISRKVVNPEALTIGKERFEVRDDFVIVLRVLSKEEIQAYASATQVLRERRRRGEEDGGYSTERDHDRDEEERHRHHRHRRHHDDEERDDDGGRRRRHREDERDADHRRSSYRDRDALAT